MCKLNNESIHLVEIYQPVSWGLLSQILECGRECAGLGMHLHLLNLREASLVWFSGKESICHAEDPAESGSTPG